MALDPRPRGLRPARKLDASYRRVTAGTAMSRRTGVDPEPDAQTLELLREVRRRIRAGNPEHFLAHLSEEPPWVAALPKAEAAAARKMLAATRELARRAIAERRGESSPVPVAALKPLPRRTPEQEARNLALAQRADEREVAVAPLNRPPRSR